MWEELSRAQETISQATGEVPRYFRPPGGDYNATVLRVASQLRMVTVFWTDNPGDYANPDPRTLEVKLFLGASNGGIILLHQGIPETVRTLPMITRIAIGRGLMTVLTMSVGNTIIPLVIPKNQKKWRRTRCEDDNRKHEGPGCDPG